MRFSNSGLRRNRMHAWLRRAVREVNLRPSDFVLPIFVRNENASRVIEGMPNVFRLTVSEAAQEAKRARDFGISAVLLFPACGKRSKDAAEAYNPDNLVMRAVSEIKDSVNDIGVITDVALDPYTTDGHDGITDNGVINNDLTVEILCKQAVAQAKAGVDVVAPSDMMDRRVYGIREALDKEGFRDVGIMSYAAKFCSKLYTPFREAVGLDSAISRTIDKSGYQLDVANINEAMREIAQDIEEGADTVIIKPSLFYLDVIREAKNKFNIPIVGYVVSGEYAMIASQPDKESVMYEAYMCVKRAGASIIIAYNAVDFVKDCLYVRKS